MPKMPPRGKAAEKLLSGMPEEDPTMESPSAPQAGQGDMPPMPDGMMDQTPAAPPDAGAPPPGGPEGAPEAPDIDSALSGIEAAIQGYSEDSAREIRTHLEAIKDIASREEGSEKGREDILGPQDPNQAPPDMPSSADIGGEMGQDDKR